MIALKNAGIIVDNPATFSWFGKYQATYGFTGFIWLLMIVVLHQLKVRGAIIISILTVTAIATALGLNEFKGVAGQIPSIAPTFMQMDFEGLFYEQYGWRDFAFFIVDFI